MTVRPPAGLTYKQFDTVFSASDAVLNRIRDKLGRVNPHSRAEYMLYAACIYELHMRRQVELMFNQPKPKREPR